jgi:hypothetical protein
MLLLACNGNNGDAPTATAPPGKTAAPTQVMPPPTVDPVLASTLVDLSQMGVAAVACSGPPDLAPQDLQAIPDLSSIFRGGLITGGYQLEAISEGQYLITGGELIPPATPLTSQDFVVRQFGAIVCLFPPTDGGTP